MNRLSSVSNQSGAKQSLYWTRGFTTGKISLVVGSLSPPNFFGTVVKTQYAEFIEGAAKAILWGLILLATLISPTPILAQSGTDLSGVVEDPGGGVIPGATLTLTNHATSEVRSAVSDGDGHFRFANVPPGIYTLVTQAEEFRPRELEVTVGSDSVEIKVRLKIASEEQRVTVTATQSDRVPAEENANAMTFSDTLFRELPTESQDILPLLSNFLSPATQGSEGASIIVDGVELNELDVPTSSIKEVTFNRNPYSTEFRRPGSSRIEVTTRQASRKYYHGAIAFYARNSALDARNAFALTKPNLDRRLWEGVLSGPFVKRRATFYLAGSHLRNEEDVVVNANTLNGKVVQNVPTRQDRTTALNRLDFYPNRVHTVTAVYAFNLQTDGNLGVGGSSLPQQGIGDRLVSHRVEITDQAAPSPSWLNNFRFLFRRKDQDIGMAANMPTIIVNGEFKGGPSSKFRTERETTSELNDVATYSHGANSIRFGIMGRARLVDTVDASNFNGTFEFASLPDFASQMPFVFRVNQGRPNISLIEYEVYGFFQDEIKLRSNLSLLLGVRYDWQSLIEEQKDVAPRVAISFAPGKQKTVIRAGAGLFYDRLPEAAFKLDEEFDGVRAVQVMILNPCYPNAFAMGCPSFLPSIVRIASELRAPYLLQATVGVEQELWKGSQLTVEGQTLRGVHLFRSRDINAPLPATGLRPNPNFFIINQFESSATQSGNALNVTFRSQIRRRFDILAQYAFSHTINDTSGIFSLPANNYDLQPERGPADFDQRHRFNLAAGVNLPAGFRLGTVLSATTGPPFNITSGAVSPDGIANLRPPGVSRNTGQGPGLLRLDVRFTKAFHFPRLANRERSTRNLEFNVDAFNALNRTNFNNFVGVQTSHFFGHANSAVPPRLIQLSVRYHF